MPSALACKSVPTLDPSRAGYGVPSRDTRNIAQVDRECLTPPGDSQPLAGRSCRARVSRMTRARSTEVSIMSNVYSYRSGVLGTGAGQDFSGFDVEATDGSIGKIDEATYETEASYMVVDTGFWIFGKKRLVPAGVVERVDPADHKLVAITRPGRDLAEQRFHRRQRRPHSMRAAPAGAAPRAASPPARTADRRTRRRAPERAISVRAEVALRRSIRGSDARTWSCKLVALYDERDPVYPAV